MPALEHLSKKDRKRARAQIQLKRQAEACLDNQCRDKIQHEDFWSAYQHAYQLGKATGILYMIYHCETCGFAHVGHTDQPTVTWMMEGYAEKVDTKLSIK